MINYIKKQQHKLSCGPVAIMNALKWLGESVSYKKDLKLFEQIGYTIKHGWWRHELRRGLNYFNIKHKLYKQPTLQDMKNILKRGNSIILAYDWFAENSDGGHYIFMDSYNGKYFQAYNVSKKGKEKGKINDMYMKQTFYMSRLDRKNNKKGRKCAEVWEIYSN